MNADLEQRVAERTKELAAARDEAEQANRAKSEFLSRVSHELRTPLNAILGFAQVLEMENLGPRQQTSIKHILSGGWHLLQLINEVLDIAQVESGRINILPESVAIRQLVAETLDLAQPLAAQRGIQLTLAEMSTASPHYVWADRQRFKQVLLNLLSNAIKYNREQGAVTIACQPRPENRLRIQVRDTGPGIPVDKLDRVFLPFDRLGAEASGVEGTGLGLALSRRLMEEMNGTIGVESTVGQGCTFWVELPVVEEPAQQMAHTEYPTSVAATAPDRRKTVLYVEDKLASVELLEQVIRAQPGIELISAMQGRMCLELARQHRPDLILLDLSLPDMHGEDVLQQLHLDIRTQDIPVVILSAEALPNQTNRLQEMGVRAYLAKPLDLRRFLQTLDGLLV